jgi:hypothetical protein
LIYLTVAPKHDANTLPLKKIQYYPILFESKWYPHNVQTHFGGKIYYFLQPILPFRKIHPYLQKVIWIGGDNRIEFSTSLQNTKSIPQCLSNDRGISAQGHRQIHRTYTKKSLSLNGIRFRLHTGQSMKPTMATYIRFWISKTAAC